MVHKGLKFLIGTIQCWLAELGGNKFNLSWENDYEYVCFSPSTPPQTQNLHAIYFKIQSGFSATAYCALILKRVISREQGKYPPKMLKIRNCDGKTVEKAERG